MFSFLFVSWSFGKIFNIFCFCYYSHTCVQHIINKYHNVKISISEMQLTISDIWSYFFTFKNWILWLEFEGTCWRRAQIWLQVSTVTRNKYSEHHFQGQVLFLIYNLKVAFFKTKQFLLFFTDLVVLEPC